MTISRFTFGGLLFSPVTQFLKTMYRGRTNTYNLIRTNYLNTPVIALKTIIRSFHERIYFSIDVI